MGSSKIKIIILFFKGGGKQGQPPKKKPKFMGYKEDPFLFFDDNDEAFTEIQKYFEGYRKHALGSS